MKKLMAKKAGFTLIELMIVVAILGILAAIAIPAFATYIRRSKAGEVAGNIEGLFKAVSTYYNKEFTSGPTVGASQFAHCTVAATPTLGTPTDVKQIPATALFDQATDPLGELGGIGFNPGASYYLYENRSTLTAGCGQAANTAIYTLAAEGDLDGDGTTSLFQLATTTNDANEIYKAGTMYILSELE